MFFFIFLEKNTLDIDVSIRYGLYEYEMKLRNITTSSLPVSVKNGENSILDEEFHIMWKNCEIKGTKKETKRKGEREGERKKAKL